MREKGIIDRLHRLHLATPAEIIFLERKSFANCKVLPHLDEIFRFRKAELVAGILWILLPPGACTIGSDVASDLEFLDGFHLDLDHDHRGLALATALQLPDFLDREVSGALIAHEYLLH